MILTSSERVLVHLHAFWNAREPSREMTQAGISEAARILRSHVPRALHALLREGLVEVVEAHLRGRTRKTRVYRLTEAGVRRARELLASMDATPVEVDGRHTTLGEVRILLRLSPLAAALGVDEDGRLRPAAQTFRDGILLQREDDLAFLRRWTAGAAPIAVVYGSKGMGKTALGRAFARGIARTAWVDLEECSGLSAFAMALERGIAISADDPQSPRSIAQAILSVFDRDTKLFAVDGYGDVAEDLVDTFASFVRLARGRSAVKLLVLAQETTPAYCRFYARADVAAGSVVERHLKGLDLEGCRALLANPAIDEEALRRIYLLTKGCPLYLRCIRDGDEEGLRAASRFTKAEIRLLLYSGRAVRASSVAS